MPEPHDIQISAAAAKAQTYMSRGHSTIETINFMLSNPNYNWMGDEALTQAVGIAEKNWTAAKAAQRLADDERHRTIEVLGVERETAIGYRIVFEEKIGRKDKRGGRTAKHFGTVFVNAKVNTPIQDVIAAARSLLEEMQSESTTFSGRGITITTANVAAAFIGGVPGAMQVP